MQSTKVPFIKRDNTQKALNKHHCHDAFRLEFFDRIETIKDIWDKLAPTDNLLFSSRFMQFMEDYSPRGLEMRYILVFRTFKPIGIIPCALKRFKAKESIQQVDGTKPSWFKRIMTNLRSKVVEKVSFNTLVCGNILFTGEYAFYFNETQLSFTDQFNIVEKALLEYQYHLLGKGLTLNVTFMKDFYFENGFAAQKMDSSAFNEFKVQPNMILEINENWREFDDYLASFHSKARVRARKAFKRGQVFKRKQMSLSDVEGQEDAMFELYKSISEDASFNLFELTRDYFSGLKRELGDCVSITGYYLDGRLVAFFSHICNQDELIAHFLGYDKNLIKSHDIYLNILYDLVRYAFQTGCSSLNLGRTALEIKSSIGALPHDMFCYIKHRKHINNLFVPALVKYLNPEESWKIRNPFKNNEI